ncbi:MAG: hypothetical protein Q8K60_01395 [Parachlamydiaceae bacterium]|nr:hypothetical protein [Parachlamydiaceae bacterium]
MLNHMISKIYTLSLCGLLFAPYYSFGQTNQPNQYRNNSQYYYTGAHPERDHSLNYYPNYYHDPYYYYNPQEEYGFRTTDWNFHNNWHYARNAYLRGKNQPEYYQDRHPYGPGGVGYDADDEYLNVVNQLSQNQAAQTRGRGGQIANRDRSDARSPNEYYNPNYSPGHADQQRHDH